MQVEAKSMLFLSQLLSTSFFETGSKPRDPAVSASTELGLQSHAIFI